MPTGETRLSQIGETQRRRLSGMETSIRNMPCAKPYGAPQLPERAAIPGVSHNLKHIRIYHVNHHPTT
jgi:hypothetical protein